MSSGRRRAWRSRHKVQLSSIWIAVLLVLLIAALLFTGAVMLGNHLRKQAETIGKEHSNAEETTPDFDSSNVPAVIARSAVFGQTPEPLGEIPSAPPETEPSDVATASPPDSATESPEGLPSPDNSETASLDLPETSGTPAEDTRTYNAYCVVMRGEDGDLLYRSELREYLLGTDPDNSLPELTAGVAEFNGAYLSGIFYAGYSDASENMRQTVRSYEISLAAELANCGFDDIVISGIPFDADAADFCAAIKERTSSGCRIGISVSYEFLSSDKARESLVRLSGSFDFIALDLYSVEVPAMMSKAEALSSRLHIVRSLVGIYRVRVLIPNEAGLSVAALNADAVNIAEIITGISADEAS